MKKCTKCYLDKDISEFYKYKSMKDNHRNECRYCMIIHSAEYAKKNSDHVREYKRKHSSQPSSVAVRRLYSKTKAGKLAQAKANKKTRNKYANANKARYLFANAVRDGKITRGSNCEECQSIKNIQGHHDDYNFHLQVRWLCIPCHRDWHKENTPLNRETGIFTEKKK